MVTMVYLHSNSRGGDVRNTHA